jgi:hypothetical protein
MRKQHKPLRFQRGSEVTLKGESTNWHPNGRRTERPLLPVQSGHARRPDVILNSTARAEPCTGSEHAGDARLAHV